MTLADELQVVIFGAILPFYKGFSQMISISLTEDFPFLTLPLNKSEKNVTSLSSNVSRLKSDSLCPNSKVAITDSVTMGRYRAARADKNKGKKLNNFSFGWVIAPIGSIVYHVWYFVDKQGKATKKCIGTGSMK